MSINRVIISGRLTREPELRSTQAGTQVLSMGVAVNDRRRNPQSGEWEDYANFIDCTMFGARAESLSRILAKGSKVCIEGKLRYSKWERDGQTRSKLEVVVDEVELMSGTGQGGNGNASGYASPRPQQAYAPAPQYGQPQPMAMPPYEAYAAPQVAPAPVPAPQPAEMPQVIDATASVYDDEIPF